jgi:esterase/lipase superfamily enzyme
MGSQIVLNAIAKAVTQGDKPSLSEIVLAAPDVNWRHFERLGPFLTKVSNGVTLYASSQDVALSASAEWNGKGGPRAGSIPPAGPMVLKGIDTIDVTSLGPDMLRLVINPLESLSESHDLVLRARLLLNDIGLLFSGGVHPPNSRSPVIHSVPEGSKSPQYWIVPN